MSDSSAIGVDDLQPIQGGLCIIDDSQGGAVDFLGLREVGPLVGGEDGAVVLEICVDNSFVLVILDERDVALNSCACLFKFALI